MKKQAMLDAAMDEFSRYDFDQASVNRIIEVSGTSKGTFYHYFRSKEALYLELIRLVAEEKVRYLKENRISIPNQESVSIWSLLKNQMEHSLYFGLENPKMAAFAAKAANEPNSNMKEKTEEVIGYSAKEFLIRLLDEEIAMGRIRGDLPLTFVRDIFSYMMTHFNDFLHHSDVPIQLDHRDQILAYICNYLDFMEKGLNPRLD
jgi:AcrR family transcriptional regulator